MSALSDFLNTARPFGVSNRELAKRTGGRLSRANMDKYLRGDHGQPSRRTLEGLAAAFEVELDALVAVSGPGLLPATPSVRPAPAVSISGPAGVATHPVRPQWLATASAPDARETDTGYWPVTSLRPLPPETELLALVAQAQSAIDGGRHRHDADLVAWVREYLALPVIDIIFGDHVAQWRYARVVFAEALAEVT